MIIKRQQGRKATSKYDDDKKNNMPFILSLNLDLKLYAMLPVTMLAISDFENLYIEFSFNLDLI